MPPLVAIVSFPTVFAVASKPEVQSQIPTKPIEEALGFGRFFDFGFLCFQLCTSVSGGAIYIYIYIFFFLVQVIIKLMKLTLLTFMLVLKKYGPCGLI
jgi:hypothetical protein